jgi:nitroimidazol reductase NimA-like FMN-containing flavoprotein (pyridoxamine 5'-phosphate oxidase superfamily)
MAFTPSDIETILNQKEHWITLSTVGRDGYPHSVPLGYFLADNRIILGCRDHTQKVKNIERNSQVSLLWENGRGNDALQGIMFQGTARVVRDNQERLKLKTIACRQRGEQPPTKLDEGTVYLEVTPKKTIGWNLPSRRRGKKQSSRQTK